MTLLTDADFQTEKKVAKGWKNRYLFKAAGTIGCRACGFVRTVEAGDELLTHCLIYASADEARQANDKTEGHDYIAYLGPIQAF